MKVTTSLKSLFLLSSMVVLGQNAAEAASTSAPKEAPSTLTKKAETTTLMSPDHPFLRALTRTYGTNPALQAALRDQYATAESLPAALAGYRPTLAFEASSNRGFEDKQTTRLRGYATNHSGRLTLSQSLFAGGGTVAAVSAAEAQILAGYAAFAKTEQDTLLAAVNSYLNLWLRRFVRDLNDKNVSVKEKTLEQARARQEVGDLTSTDIAQAKSELALARSRQVTAQSDVLQAEENFRRVVGEAPPHDLPLPSEVSTFYELPADKLSYLKYARDNNPTAINARFAQEQAQHGIDVARAALLPKVNLSGSLSRNVTSDVSGAASNARTNSGSVGVSLSVPLYSGGQNWSSYRAARQRSTQARLNVRNTDRTVQEEAVQAWESFNAARDQIKHLEVQVEAAKLSLIGIREESFVGQRIFLEVLDAENRLLEAETQLAQAQVSFLIQSYTLLSVLGHLTATGLQLPVEPYPLKAYVDTLRSTWIGTVSDPESAKKVS